MRKRISKKQTLIPELRMATEAELDERDRDPYLYEKALAGIEELRQDAPRRWPRPGALEWELLWLADLECYCRECLERIP